MKKVLLFFALCFPMMNLYADEATKVKSKKQREVDDKSPKQPEPDFIPQNTPQQTKSFEVRTFREAVAEAYKNNIQLQLGRQDKNRADLELTKAKMSFLPSLEANLKTTRTKNELESSQKNNKEDKFETDTTMGLTLRQNLFAGLRTMNTVKGQSNKSRAEYYKLKNTEQELIEKVMEAYADVCFHRECLKARLQKESNLKSVWESQQSMLESGVGTPADVASAHSNYEKARFERIKELSDLTSSEAKFLECTGRRLATDADFPSLKIDLPKDLDTFLRQASVNNAKILQCKFEEKVAEYNLKVAKGKLSPTCDVSLTRQRNLTKPGPPDSNDYYKSRNTNEATLNVTVPIFSNSGGDYLDIRIASEDLMKARFSSEDAMTTTKKESVVAWNEYISAGAMEKSCRSTLNSARLSSDSYREEGKYGNKSNTEILDEENKLLDAKINLADSKKRRSVSGIKILYYAGKLDFKDIVPDSPPPKNTRKM